jgi:hypothetical protein
MLTCVNCGHNCRESWRGHSRTPRLLSYWFSISNKKAPCCMGPLYSYSYLSVAEAGNRTAHSEQTRHRVQRG